MSTKSSKETKLTSRDNVLLSREDLVMDDYLTGNIPCYAKIDPKCEATPISVKDANLFDFTKGVYSLIAERQKNMMIKVDLSEEEFYAYMLTINVINCKDRSSKVDLEFQEWDDYRIFKWFENLILPGAVTVKPGLANPDLSNKKILAGLVDLKYVNEKGMIIGKLPMVKFNSITQAITKILKNGEDANYSVSIANALEEITYSKVWSFDGYRVIQDGTINATGDEDFRIVGFKHEVPNYLNAVDHNINIATWLLHRFTTKWNKVTAGNTENK